MNGILFLCVANSARSQMAEGIARALAPAGTRIWSAGSRPTHVRPEAVQVLGEIGLDISGHRSKAVAEVPAAEVDTVITLCAEEECPVFLGRARRLHWGLPDPAAAQGGEAERLAAFRQVRDELRRRLQALLGDAAAEPPPPALAPPPGRDLYCNRTLNLRAIRAIGYDMDYTLIHYHVEEWERRAFEHMQGRLAAAGWPVDDLAFDPEFAIRGLVIDAERGNLVKPDRFGYVRTALHGTAPLTFDEMRRTYARTAIDLAEPRWVFLNTFFSLSEACLYAGLVDRLDRRHRGDERPEVPNYADLFRRVKACVDATHMEGQLKAEIVAAPERYVDLDPDAAQALLDQRAAGKKLMLITNSEWTYTRSLMSYAFDRFLPAGRSWRDLFDVIIVGARKPEFFSGRGPLFRVVDDEGLLAPAVGGLTDGGAFYGGSATQVEGYLAFSGDEILYVGDHIYGDVNVSKRVLRWRTALVVRELEREVAAIAALAPLQARLDALMARKEQEEAHLCQLRLELARRRGRPGPAGDAERSAGLQAQVDAARASLRALDAEIVPLVQAAGAAGNARWGLLMRAGNDKSHLARQIERKADVYTSRVSNFLFRTPYVYLRPPRGSLPHDRGDGASGAPGAGAAAREDAR